jgi:hypothetical protein
MRLDRRPRLIRQPEQRAAAEEALDALCCTPPTTIAGVRAAIEYVITLEDACPECEASRAYIENLLASPLLLLPEAARLQCLLAARRERILMTDV